MAIATASCAGLDTADDANFIACSDFPIHTPQFTCHRAFSPSILDSRPSSTCRNSPPQNTRYSKVAVVRSQQHEHALPFRFKDTRQPSTGPPFGAAIVWPSPRRRAHFHRAARLHDLHQQRLSVRGRRIRRRRCLVKRPHDGARIGIAELSRQ